MFIRHGIVYSVYSSLFYIRSVHPSSENLTTYAPLAICGQQQHHNSVNILLPHLLLASTDYKKDLVHHRTNNIITIIMTTITSNICVQYNFIIISLLLGLKETSQLASRPILWHILFVICCLLSQHVKCEDIQKPYISGISMDERDVYG
ncbi:hypothetical protein GQX74_003135 [Glossina fuscipes]|nr:hypothetical protein GQX74_003135 [Glossina fuscipes]